MTIYACAKWGVLHEFVASMSFVKDELSPELAKHDRLKPLMKKTHHKKKRVPAGNLAAALRMAYPGLSTDDVKVIVDKPLDFC